jgi:hypothetical protein
MVPWFNTSTAGDDSSNSLALDTSKTSNNDIDCENEKKNAIPDSPLSLSTPNMTRR